MKNLKLNITTGEITKIIEIEKSREKKDSDYSPEIILALLTFEEHAKLEYEQKNMEFYNSHKKECDDFEKSIKSMINKRHIDYIDFLEGDYKYFYRTWVEDENHSFAELLDMMKKIIEEYEYSIFTYHMLFQCFENEYI